jgi:serine/threonine protein kinase
MMTQEEFKNRYRFDPNRDYIGGGGFGKVYRAYDFAKRHYVAIKVSEVKQEWKHFTLQREVEIVNKMPLHQNVARYDSCHRFDLGMVGTMDFAILKYYENGNLEKFLQNHLLSDLETEQMIRGILEGVLFLHKNRIIHRDLKAQNILIDREDGIWVPKITDFGLSRQVVQDSTGTNSVVGITFAYAAPEQIQNRPIQPNVDLWAAGVIIYRIVSGELPFKSDEKTNEQENTQSQMVLCRKITDGELPVKLQTLPEPYKTLISKCLVVDVTKRAQRAETLLHFLDTYIAPSQPAPNEIPLVDAPASSEPTLLWTGDTGHSFDQSSPKVESETAKTPIESNSLPKAAFAANAAEIPTVLKDSSAEIPTVLKDGSANTPTVVLPNKLLENNGYTKLLSEPTIDEGATQIMTSTPKMVEEQDDFKKQLKLWGKIAGIVCLCGLIFGYCMGQRNRSTAAAAAAPATDTTRVQKIDTSAVTIAPILDTIPTIADAVTLVPATTTALTPTATPTIVKKPVPVKGNKAPAASAKSPAATDDWLKPAPAPASTPAPAKPATPETTKVEPTKIEQKPVLASSLENMKDFTAEGSVINTHLNKINCDNFTVSFMIRANGTVDDPQLVKGNKKCEAKILAQVQSMPKLTIPKYEGKPADFKYFFTKR